MIKNFVKILELLDDRLGVCVSVCANERTPLQLNVKSYMEDYP